MYLSSTSIDQWFDALYFSCGVPCVDIPLVILGNATLNIALLLGPAGAAS